MRKIYRGLVILVFTSIFTGCLNSKEEISDKTLDLILVCENATAKVTKARKASTSDIHTCQKAISNLEEVNFTNKKMWLGESYYNVSIMYMINSNNSESFKYLSKASELGYKKSFNNLGWLYYKGIGTSIDKIKAYKLFLKAAKNGDEYAQNNLDRLCKESPWACK